MVKVGSAMRVRLFFRLSLRGNRPSLDRAPERPSTPTGARSCFRVWNKHLDTARPLRMQGPKGCVSIGTKKRTLRHLPCAPLRRRFKKLDRKS